MRCESIGAGDEVWAGGALARRARGQGGGEAGYRDHAGELALVPRESDRAIAIATTRPPRVKARLWLESPVLAAVAGGLALGLLAAAGAAAAKIAAPPESADRPLPLASQIAAATPFERRDAIRRRRRGVQDAVRSGGGAPAPFLALARVDPRADCDAARTLARIERFDLAEAALANCDRAYTHRTVAERLANAGRFVDALGHLDRVMKGAPARGIEPQWKAVWADAAELSLYRRLGPERSRR